MAIHYFYTFPCPKNPKPTFLNSSLIWIYNLVKEKHAGTVFSPGRGLAGFLQEKLKWRIKTKKMRPLGRRGELRVKRT